jgi:hypothetical protein
VLIVSGTREGCLNETREKCLSRLSTAREEAVKVSRWGLSHDLHAVKEKTRGSPGVVVGIAGRTVLM